jgi:FkbM family methyltransferase
MDVTWPRPIGTLAFALAWLAPWRPAFRTRASQSGLAFFVHHRDTIGRHIAKYGTHEPLLTRWLADYLAVVAPPAIVVDVGANVGWHALHAARERNVETVVAFEPDPFNAWLLDRALQENAIDNVIVDPRAVGAAPGTARLYRYKSSNFGRHSLAADHGFGSCQVPVTDLDGALASLGYAGKPIAALKIDVEGYEPAVIAGATGALLRAGAVIVEYSPELSAGAGLSAADMLTRLRGLGFTPFVLRSDGGTSRTNVAELSGLQGSLDVIWLRVEATLSEVMTAMNERPRDGLSLLQIAEQNKRVMKPTGAPTSP